MKKLLSLILVFVVTLSLAVLPACGVRPLTKSKSSFLEIIEALSTSAGGAEAKPDVDQAKSILHIGNYEGIVRETWLENTIARFEEVYKDYSFEEGKTGVQVVVESDKHSFIGAQFINTVQTSKNVLFFVDGVEYYEGVSMGAFKDLTAIIQEDCYGEERSIEDKIGAEKLNALDVNGKIYAIPHYETYPGITYDATLFENENLYFSDQIDYDGTRSFVTDTYKVKSCGPDGETGNSDDGLPSSIEEFCRLIDKINSLGIIPFAPIPQNMFVYGNYLLQALTANLLGKEKLDNIVYGLGNNFYTEIITAFNDEEPVISNVYINQDNAYLIRQMPEIYSALKVMDKADFVAGDSNDTEQDYIKNFLTSGYEGTAYAMMIGCSAWNHIAHGDEIFNDIENTYAGEYDKDIRFMPLPVITSGTITGLEPESDKRNQTLTEVNNSYAVINGNADEVSLTLATEFLKFCYSDNELGQFTADTHGVMKAVDYSLSDNTYASLDSYAKSIVDMRQSSDFCYIRNNDPIFNQNQDLLSIRNMQFWISKTYVTNYPIIAFMSNVSVKDYFTGMWTSQSEWQNRWSQI